MSKKSRFKRPFDKKHCKGAQAPLKSAAQHLYHIHWSLPSQVSWKKFLFLTCKILGLLVNTSASDEKYPFVNRHNLAIPIQVQLKKKKTFSNFQTLDKIFNCLKKKMTLIDFVFPKLWTPKTESDKCLKNPVLEDASTSNMVNVPKHCWNLHQRPFIIFIDRSQGNWVVKSLSYWHAKFWDCFITQWLPVKSILFLIETI